MAGGGLEECCYLFLHICIRSKDVFLINAFTASTC